MASNLRGRPRLRPPLTAVAFIVVCAVLAAPPRAGAEPAGAAVEEGLAQVLAEERATIEAVGVERVAALSQEALAPMPRQLAPGEPPAPGAPLTFAALDARPLAEGDAEHRCLAEAIYYESRGEPLLGQIAVAEVVLNRVDARSYPNTICGVTRQGTGNGRACQFSYACNGKAERMASRLPRERAQKLATLMLEGRPRTVTDGATHFHATYVRPGWARSYTRTAAIGAHLFYRPSTQVAQR